MRFFQYRHQIGFADTMAYGSHHFLTNFKLQCLAREALLFLRDKGGADPWRRQLEGVELLTQQGYARNLRPVGLGDWLAVLLSAEELSFGSFRLCFRVVAEDGSPVTCGFQTIVCIGDGGTVVRTPAFISEHLRPLLEPEQSSFQDRVTSGGRAALEQVFWPALRKAGAAVAAGAAGTHDSFASVVDPLPEPARALKPNQPVRANSQQNDERKAPELAWVCGGQARPDPSWVLTLARRHPPLRELIDRADELCSAALGEGHNAYTAWLAKPEMAGDERATCLKEQLTIYLTAVMTGRAYERAGLEPNLLVGHSVGEIAALALAGVVRDVDGLTIVARRTEALLALAGVDGGLVAVQAGVAAVSRLLVAEPGLTMAVHNHAEQVVLAGSEQALQRLVAGDPTADETQMKRLASRFAFHSPLLLDAVAPFARSLGDIVFKPAARRLFSPMERAFSEPHWQWPQLLASHLVRPLYFADAIAQLMLDQGSQGLRFVECNRRGSLRSALQRLVRPDHILAAGQFISTKTEDARSRDAELPAPQQNSHTTTPTLEPMAIVGRGCVLPGAADPTAFGQLIETDRTAIADADCPALMAALTDFYAPAHSTPDKTYALLGGRVDQLAPLPQWLRDQLRTTLPKVAHLAALALLQCDVQPTEAERVHVVFGSTADGCGEYDEAVALSRLARSSSDQQLRSACSALAGAEHDSYEQLEPHGGFGRLARALFGSNARVTIVDAACASSLYAIDIAARLFAADEADVVIAGGAFAPGASNNCLFAQFGGLSSTGSYPLDARADGVVFGEGAAFLALRRLPLAIDRDHTIFGVVRGWGYSSDGRSASASAPKSAGQQLAVARAYQHGQLDPRHTQYVETHGTGTRVGDAVELKTLKSFFESCSTSPLPIGSVKSQLGHTGWVAGATSLIKVLHLLQKETLPAQQCFDYPNPQFELNHSRLMVPVAASPWPANLDGVPRRAAVNGFGFGGTNGHVVLEAYIPTYHSQLAAETDRVAKRTPTSARMPTSLARHSLHMTRHDKRELPTGLLVLPEVLNSMDRTQLLAVNLAAACMQQLGPHARFNGATAAVFVSLAGRTRTIVEANDRLFADRFTRLLSALRPAAREAIRAAVGQHIAAVKPSHPYTLTGGMPNITAGRVCQLLGFNGPNFVLDPTAGGGVSPAFCARSAVADGSCSLALALEIDEVGEVLHGTAEVWGDAAEVLGVPAPVAAAEPREPRRRISSTQLREGFDRSAPISTFTPGFAPLSLPVSGLPTAAVTLLSHNAETHVRLCRLADNRGWSCRLLSADGSPDYDEWQALSKSNAIVIVHDFTGHDPRGVVDDPSRTRVLIGSLMRIAKARYDDIASGAVALGVICLDAWIDDELPHPDSGLIAGFLKALRRELNAARMALVHTDGSLEDALEHLQASWSASAIASPDRRKIQHDDAARSLPLEVFVRRGLTFQHALRPLAQPRRGQRPLLTPDSVLVATGGGRGITAELVAAAITRFGCRAVLLGRTDPALAPAAWQGLDAAGINELEPAFHAEQARAGIRLRDSKRAFLQRLAAHELWHNLKRLRAAGEVDYAICDVTDAEAVSAAIAGVVRDRGSIDLLLHGAGIQVSARLPNTTDEDFWRTIDTKIAGLRNLLAALARHPEGRDAHIHLATSAFSYLGNDGQHSYGAANEAMNRLADCFAAGRRTRGSWSAMAWLAWDGIGMTRGSEYRTLAGNRRLRGLAAEEGGMLWTDRLASPLAAGSHILLSDNELESYCPLLMAPREGSVQPRSRDVGALFSATDSFDPRIHPFLFDHRVDGRPVLPACLLVDGIVTHAEALFGPSGGEPALVCSAVEDCRLLRFLPVARDQACTVTYQYRISSRDGDGVRVAVEARANVVHSTSVVLEESRLYATCNLTLRRCLPKSPPSSANAASAGQAHTKDPFVAIDSPVALAGDFDCVRELTVNRAGNGARFRPARPLPLLLRGRTLPALLLDALLRVGIIGAAADDRQQASRTVYVPVAFARMQRFQIPAGADENDATIHCGPAQRDATSVFCPSVVADIDGRTILQLSNYSGQLRRPRQRRRMANDPITKERVS